MKSPDDALLSDLIRDSENYVKTASMLKLLSNPNRLMILNILADAPRSVNEIHAILVEVSNISQSSLSQHLALLRAHNIVTFRKTGQLSIYQISNEHFKRFLTTLKEINI